MVKGRLTVDEFLHVSGHREVYAIGDAAAVADLTKPLDKDDLRPVCPPTAQHAMRQATAVARNIRAGLGRGAVKPYRHRDLGLVVDLGGPDAAASRRPDPNVGDARSALRTSRRRAAVGRDGTSSGPSQSLIFPVEVLLGTFNGSG